MPRGSKKKEEEPTVEQPDLEAAVETSDEERFAVSLSETGETSVEMPADEPETDSAETKETKPKKRQKTKGSKDTFLGQSVVAFVTVLLLAGAGFFVYLGYRVVEEQKDERESIEVLSTRDPEPAPTAATEPEPETEPEPPTELDKSSVEIVVLNGGAPGGTAGKVTKVLSDAGFTKAKADNATGNYTGVSIHFGEGARQAADAVKEALSETYDEISVEPSDANKKDTTLASIVVIVAR